VSIITGMDLPRARDETDAAQDLARDLADLAAQLASLKGEANAYLRVLKYATLWLQLGNAHAAVEAATIEANRPLPLNEGR
jgi:hypothetical protein